MKRLASIASVLLVAISSLIATVGDQFPILSDVRHFLVEFLNQSGYEGYSSLQGPVNLVRVSDGDTITVRIEGKEESIRLVGIDTPEKFHSAKLERDAEESPLTIDEIKELGKQASAYAEALVASHPLYLEFDATERDRYGRLLAYVYFEDPQGAWDFDGKTFTQVNMQMVLGGWAEPLTIPPNVKYVDNYTEAVKLARDAKRGMWASY